MYINIHICIYIHTYIHIYIYIYVYIYVYICSVTHCNTLQHTATHCNTLQHTATTQIYHAVVVGLITDTMTLDAPLYGTFCCSVLQCVAVCCSALQCVAVVDSLIIDMGWLRVVGSLKV